MSQDKEDSKVLVISRYGLDARAYNEELTDITWETCDLRNWLNETFYEEAFSSEEQMQIEETAVKAEDNEVYGIEAGNDTTDKIFLLSISEAEELFKDDESRMCYPTEYAYAQGVYVSASTGSCLWWLRSPGHSSIYAVDDFDGSVIYYGNNVISVNDSVRPALWINLDS